MCKHENSRKTSKIINLLDICCDLLRSHLYACKIPLNKSELHDMHEKANMKAIKIVCKYPTKLFC